MLDSLHIENMAVIECLDVDFSERLSVITGETGSGKSVMLHALSFLLGGKPARELVRNGAQSALVSAVFSDVGADCEAFLEEAGLPNGEELMLQRTLDADGKSKCRLNGRVIPQSLLRELAGRLVSIHGQNDNQLLLQSGTQHKILNSICDFDEDLRLYRECFRARRETEQALQRVKKDAAEAARLGDILRFQIGEIDGVRLREGEEEELLQKRNKLQNLEKIAKQAEFTYHVLYGSEKGAAALLLERASQAMHQLASVVPEAEQAAQKLISMRYEVEDIANTARDLAENTDGKLSAAERRLMSRKSGNIPSCNLPDVTGRKLARRVCSAEVVDKEVVSTVVSVVDTLKLLRKSLGRLNGRGKTESKAVGNRLYSRGVVLGYHRGKLLRVKLL